MSRRYNQMKAQFPDKTRPEKGCLHYLEGARIRDMLGSPFLSTGNYRALTKQKCHRHKYQRSSGGEFFSSLYHDIVPKLGNRRRWVVRVETIRTAEALVTIRMPRNLAIREGIECALANVADEYVTNLSEVGGQWAGSERIRQFEVYERELKKMLIALRESAKKKTAWNRLSNGGPTNENCNRSIA